MMLVHHGRLLLRRHSRVVTSVRTRTSSATEPAIAGTAFVASSVCFAVACLARVLHALWQWPQNSDNWLFFRSVTSMQPGAWVMANGGLAAAIAACGVTPQAQNTGSSPAFTGTASP